jgi:hypothetical protein
MPPAFRSPPRTAEISPGHWNKIGPRTAAFGPQTSSFSSLLKNVALKLI